jgi:hypothetical protein
VSEHIDRCSGCATPEARVATPERAMQLGRYAPAAKITSEAI